MINKVLTGLMIVFLMSMNIGCIATIKCVQKYNDKVDERAMELKVLTSEDGEQTGVVAVDISQIGNLTKGYWAAWKNEPSSMAASAGIDTLLIAAVAAGGKAIYEAATKKDDKQDNDGKINVFIEGNHENITVNIIYGDNNSENNDGKGDVQVITE